MMKILNALRTYFPIFIQKSKNSCGIIYNKIIKATAIVKEWQILIGSSIAALGVCLTLYVNNSNEINRETRERCKDSKGLRSALYTEIFALSSYLEIGDRDLIAGVGKSSTVGVSIPSTKAIYDASASKFYLLDVNQVTSLVRTHNAVEAVKTAMTRYRTPTPDFFRFVTEEDKREGKIYLETVIENANDARMFLNNSLDGCGVLFPGAAR